jgi:hypothetical protein
MTNNRNMPGHIAWRGAVEARIVGDFDLPPKSAKA